MKNEFLLNDQFRDEKIPDEFEIFDGEAFITFNLIEVDEERGIITVAVTDRGHISVTTYELRYEDGYSYFEYGSTYSKIVVNQLEA